jgi:O-antigen/teichoic acid export membrane protein
MPGMAVSSGRSSACPRAFPPSKLLGLLFRRILATNQTSQPVSKIRSHLSQIPAAKIMSENRSFLSAVKWAYVGQWGDRAFSAIFTFVLAALLGPRDFGLVAIGLVYLTFMQMFLDQGLVAALIRKADLQPEHCDSVFWMNLLLSAVLVVFTIAVAGWWGRFNHAPELRMLLSVMSLSIPLEGLSIVQSALMRRSMDFKSLSIRSNVSVLIGGAAGIGMAVSGFGPWALVGQQLCRDTSALVLLWRLGSWRPGLRFSWMHLKELLGFSTNNFVAQLGTFADAQAGPVVLGALFGPVAVGLYRLADRLMASVIMLASSIQTVSLPEFSRVQDRRCAQVPCGVSDWPLW